MEYLIGKIVKHNIFNEFNAVEIYCSRNDESIDNVKFQIKDIDNRICFKENNFITIGVFDFEIINKNLSLDDKENKILSIRKINNHIVLDSLSTVSFIYDNKGNIEEIGTKSYIQKVEINNKEIKLDSSSTIFRLKEKNLNDRKNAFEYSLYSKYEQESIIKCDCNDICLTRLVYNYKKTLDEINTLEIKVDFDENIKKYRII